MGGARAVDAESGTVVPCPSPSLLSSSSGLAVAITARSTSVIDVACSVWECEGADVLAVCCSYVSIDDCEGGGDALGSRSCREDMIAALCATAC